MFPCINKLFGALSDTVEIISIRMHFDPPFAVFPCQLDNLPIISKVERFNDGVLLCLFETVKMCFAVVY